MKIKSWGMEYDVIPVITKYAMGDTLAIQLVCDDGEPYGVLTVKLDDRLEDDVCAYVDVNNIPGAEEFIRENGLGVFTGVKKVSGYCEYPLYKFNVRWTNSEIASWVVK